MAIKNKSEIISLICINNYINLIGFTHCKLTVCTERQLNLVLICNAVSLSDIFGFFYLFYFNFPTWLLPENSIKKYHTNLGFCQLIFNLTWPCEAGKPFFNVKICEKHFFILLWPNFLNHPWKIPTSPMISPHFSYEMKTSVENFYATYLMLI